MIKTKYPPFVLPNLGKISGDITLKLAEKWGFEPQLGVTPLPVFKTSPFSHLGISPCVLVDHDGFEPSTPPL